MANVFVLGGTGLLGYQTVYELIKQNYDVATISRNKEIMDELMPREVEERYTGDIHTFSDQQILDMLEDKDMFIHAAGLDERTLPEAPAVRFYYDQNVLTTQRLARLARQAGVKKFVIYGSYHARFAEEWPELGMAKEEPYPRTRLLQEETAFIEGTGAMDVMSLRLPYIFGTMPHRTPLWKSFIPQVQGKDTVAVLGGGTAMVTVQQVAEAGVGALEHGEHGKTYAISGKNMTYKDFYELIAYAIGQKNTVAQVMPLEDMKPAFQKLDEQAAAEGKEHGIHMATTAELQNRFTYIDPQETQPILNYSDDDVTGSIIHTIQSCLD